MLDTPIAAEQEHAPPSPEATPPFTLATQSTTHTTHECGPILSGDLETKYQPQSPDAREESRKTLLKKTLTDFDPAHNKIYPLPSSCKIIKKNMQELLSCKDTTLKKNSQATAID